MKINSDLKATIETKDKEGNKILIQRVFDFPDIGEKVLTPSAVSKELLDRLKKNVEPLIEAWLDTSKGGEGK